MTPADDLAERADRPRIDSHDGDDGHEADEYGQERRPGWIGVRRSVGRDEDEERDGRHGEEPEGEREAEEGVERGQGVVVVRWGGVGRRKEGRGRGRDLREEEEDAREEQQREGEQREPNARCVMSRRPVERGEYGETHHAATAQPQTETESRPPSWRSTAARALSSAAR